MILIIISFLILILILILVIFLKNKKSSNNSPSKIIKYNKQSLGWSKELENVLNNFIKNKYNEKENIHKCIVNNVKNNIKTSEINTDKLSDDIKIKIDSIYSDCIHSVTIKPHDGWNSEQLNNLLKDIQRQTKNKDCIKYLYDHISEKYTYDEYANNINLIAGEIIDQNCLHV